VNKRARMRLIGVTAIILVVVVVLVVSFGKQQGAVSTNLNDVASGKIKPGQRVQVQGAVVAGSWNKQSNPMLFSIRNESDQGGSGPTVRVSYSGTAPDTFGDGVVAIVTGSMNGARVFQASSMITKCPSKYQAATGAIPLGSLGAGESMVGKSLQVSGYVKPGSTTTAGKLVLAEKADGSGKNLDVTLTGALPATVKDGSQVVLTGTLKTNTLFAATSVSAKK
jgi:cytochrome c-type biogenesis protein CcmE